MSEYKRLTKKDKYGHWYTDTKIYDRFMWSEDGKVWERDLTHCAFDGEAIDRLAELEDKIESHKLVELKYRNGDYVFFISWLSGNVCEGTVVDWQEDSGYCIICGNDMISAYECFSTEAEAKKELEELSKNT